MEYRCLYFEVVCIVLVGFLFLFCLNLWFFSSNLTASHIKKKERYCTLNFITCKIIKSDKTFERCQIMTLFYEVSS